MGWKQYARSIDAANRREHRAAERRYRELVKEQKRLHKEAEQERAAEEAARYEWYVDSLVSLHAETVEKRDWRDLMSRSAPIAPSRKAIHESRAQSQVDAYQPGFIEKLFGGAKKHAAELAANVVHGRQQDEAEFQAASAEYRRQHSLWERSRQLAPGVLGLELRAASEALAFCESFKDLASFQTRVTLDALDTTTATVSCLLEDPDLVPTEEVKLTASGKVSQKELPPAKYWALYQDHVCSCAIRVARETFAVLEVERCIVNVKTPRINRATGHVEPDCILAVQFTRKGISNLRLESIDPSDAMRNFNHRMKFKKASGFETVEPSSTEEAWVST